VTQRLTSVEIVHRAGNELGESVLWDGAREQLLWVDIQRGLLFRREHGSGAVREYQLPERVGSVGLRAGGGLVVALASGFALSDAEGGELERLEAIEADLPTTRLNDGRVDRQGRFVCGGMDEAGDQQAITAVYRLRAGEPATRIIGDIACANSLCFSPDGDTMYFTDMPTKQIWAYRYDAGEGAPHTRRTLIDLRDQPGLPDGSTVDADGCVWNAQWGAGRILRITPEGAIDRVVEVPVSNPTCPAFGGPDLATLFVTSARFMLSEEQLAAEPHAGDLLAVDVGVRGLAEPQFAG
jgi:L-arabinonolactonase